MRKLVVLLTIVGLLSSVMTVLAGCGSSAPTGQPTETPPPLLTPTATASTPLVDDALSTPTPASSAGEGTEFAPVDCSGTSKATPPVDDSAPTPTPVSSADDGLEFEPVDSLGTSGKQESVAVADPDSPQKGDPGATGPVQGDAYTWQNGDRTMTVMLQADLVVEKDSGGLPRDVVAADEGGTNVVRSADGQSRSDTLPVFRSESGALMTLPGGVLLVLSSEWSQAQTNAFFSDNGIKLDRVSELDYAANGFFVETEPGFPSLDLANALAAQDGVEIASPNWGREATKK